MKKKHLLGVILFFCVVLATIIFALDRMDVISEGVALFINVSLMALYHYEKKTFYIICIRTNFMYWYDRMWERKENYRI